MVVPSPDSLPRYWLAVTDDGVSFMDLEERDSPEEEMARVGKRVFNYLHSLQAGVRAMGIEAGAGCGHPRSH